MNGVGIAQGMVGVATVAACAYMVTQGCEWWQVVLIALLGMSMTPYIRKASE